MGLPLTGSAPDMPPPQNVFDPELLPEIKCHSKYSGSLFDGPESATNHPKCSRII